MKTFAALAILVAAGSVALPHDAGAVGCLSGAAVGGVAGHYAGHHGILGAAAGCAVGHHAKVVQRRRAAEAERQGAYQQPYQR
ncbi:hypothetical protein [Acidisphaera sp. L21]|jgi:hypothetical protein|uniref:hypothetical protein n=1 Tax=Acidisphaera sp. L21 TaxID=1641851 RepID=UPI00131CB6B7|nr:hypothetical protein [Acidisphaera sp. L21]